MDQPADVADGSVNGVKNAAIRKLDHELGVPPEQLKLDKFKFLTRLHYWAADTVTHGEKRCVRLTTSMGNNMSSPLTRVALKFEQLRQTL